MCVPCVCVQWAWPFCAFLQLCWNIHSNKFWGIHLLLLHFLHVSSCIFDSGGRIWKSGEFGPFIALICLLNMHISFCFSLMAFFLLGHDKPVCSSMYAAIVFISHGILAADGQTLSSSLLSPRTVLRRTRCHGVWRWTFFSVILLCILH